MTPFEKTYSRLFMLRGVDTKHMNDCELVWNAVQRDHEAALAAAVREEREACALIAEAGKNEYIALYIRARRDRP